VNIPDPVEQYGKRMVPRDRDNVLSFREAGGFGGSASYPGASWYALVDIGVFVAKGVARAMGVELSL
jgi:hypothetical protein